MEVLLMMEFFESLTQNITKYLTMITVWDVIDILIVTVAVYALLHCLKNSTAFRVLKGILLLLLAMWVAEFLNLYVVNFILTSALQVGLLAIIILFQPEIRRMFEQFGSSSLNSILGRGQVGNMEYVVLQTVEACKALSWDKIGALIVFEKKASLVDVVKTGTVLDASLTSQLLKNVFYPKAPLHDGAVVVSGGRITGAGCMLPLTRNQKLSPDLGMRHRAGIGMSENSDALVVIVSEETGTISVAQDGVLKRHLSPETLERLMRGELLPNEEKGGKKKLGRNRKKGGGDKNG